MRKILFTILCFFCLLPMTQAKEKVDVYLFYGDGCPHCKAESEMLLNLKDSDIQIHTYEVWNNEKNQTFLEKVIEQMDLSVSGVPLTIIGSSYITGYTDEYEYTIRRMIDTCKKEERRGIIFSSSDCNNFGISRYRKCCRICSCRINRRPRSYILDDFSRIFLYGS